MGVKDLWNILSPLSDRKPLFELQGKTIAIDLSCWVVENQAITDNIVHPKMYLRNLFFRTFYLLCNNIFPIFVLEGTAPSLKHKTIAKRNEIRSGGEERKTTKKGGRSNFNHVLKECEEMLRYMGLVCIKGYGEAEAMCAYLNEDGLVDGCISQDSDCFLYGAKVVYRNFCTSTQGNRATSSGSIDEYTIDKIEEVLNIGRKKMIAMALLCGCDYDEGLSGVGKEAALKLFKIVGENEILTRMKEWKTMESKFKRLEMELSNPNTCTNCGHPGKMRSHTKVGCLDCGTKIKCNDSYKEKRILITNELTIRKKSLLVENFPSQELIDEFLLRKGPVPSKLDLKWAKPMVVKFVCFMEKKVLWEPAYAFAKIFPLMTRWQLSNLIEYPIEQRLSMKAVFVPEKVKKIRTVRSIPSYEILWLDKDNVLEGLILVNPDLEKENDEDENPDTLSELVTVEPQDLVAACYPIIVEEFEALRNAKKKKPAAKRSRKKKTDIADVENNENEPVKKPERKKRGKSKTSEITNNRKILDFVKIDKRCDNLASALAPIPSLEDAFERMSLTPNVTPKRLKTDNRALNDYPSVKKRGPQFDKVMTVERMDSILNGSLEAMFNELTPEDFPSDVEENIDMSIIVDRVCNAYSKKPERENFDFINAKVHRNVENVLESIENLMDVEPTNAKVRRSIDNVLNRIESVMNVETNSLIDLSENDEFNMLDKTYVPLDMRLDDCKKRRSLGKIQRTSSANDENDEGDRFSMGIDSLLNDTDN